MQAKTNLARSKLAAEAEVGIYVMGAVIAMLEVCSSQWLESSRRQL